MRNKETSESIATLRVYSGTLAAQEISNTLKHKPTRTLEKGEAHWITRKPSPCACWELSFREKGEHVMEIALEKLHKALKLEKPGLLQLKGEYQIEIRCVVYTCECNPGIRFEPDLLALISENGATVDIDVYCLGDDDES